MFSYCTVVLPVAYVFMNSQYENYLGFLHSGAYEDI
jgi:hypothetical protein